MTRLVVISILQFTVQASRVHLSERFRLSHGLKTGPAETEEAKLAATAASSVTDLAEVEAVSFDVEEPKPAVVAAEAKPAAAAASSVTEVDASSFDAKNSPSAADVLREMGRGINFGNTYETNHGGNDPSFERQRERIDRLQSVGFRHIRLPVTWGDRFNQNDQKTRIVEEVVRYAIRKGMFVVLNAHEERWLTDSYDGSERFDRPWFELWQNIARKFENEGARLVFELLNEPAGALGGEGGRNPQDRQAIELTRRVNQVAYDAVRSADRDRVVLVMPNGHGSHRMARHVYPDPGALPGQGRDPWVGVSVHSDEPQEFCAENGRNGFFNSIEQLEDTLRKGHGEVLEWADRTRIPVHLGSYGVGRDDNRQRERDSDVVRDYYKFMTNMFASRRFATTVWDDQQRFAIMRGQDFVFGLAESVLQQ